MITKEEFLKNTTEDEVFCLIGEFLYRARLKGYMDLSVFKKEGINEFILTDKEVITIIREILKLKY